MTILSPAAPDYTDRDFDAIKARLESLLVALYPDWTDYNRAAFGTVLVEAMCFVGDNIGFYQDNQSRETRWSTALLRKSIIEHTALISYELDGAAAATVTETFTLGSGLASGVSVTFPPGTVVKTNDRLNPVKMQLLADLVISNPDITGDGTVEHSETHTDDFTATGEADEEFTLSQTPYLDDSAVVVIGGDTWTEVDFFLDYGPTDKVYTLVVNEVDKATFKLGDGSSGALAAPGAAVTVTYKTGGGERGNVEAGTLVNIEGGPFYDSAGNPVTVTVTNAAGPDTDGADRETVAQAKIRAPRSLRALNRTIARTDYSDRAVQITGVGRALSLTSNEDPVVNEGQVWLYIVPPDATTPTGAFLTSIETEIETNYPIPANVTLVAKAPEYNDINIAATVYLASDVTEAAAEAAILAELREWFLPVDDESEPNTNVEFGYNYKDADGDAEPLISLSDLKNVINDLDEVRRLGTPADGEGMTLGGVEDNVDLSLREFPRGGTLSLTNGDTAALFSGHPISI